MMYCQLEICKQIIEKFEIIKDQQEETILKGVKCSFKEIQLNKHEDCKPIVDGLYTTFKSRIWPCKRSRYHTCSPTTIRLTQIRMKRYTK